MGQGKEGGGTVTTLRRLATAAFAIAATSACGSPVVQPHPEDAARQMAPLPACVTRLPTRRTQTGVARSLSEQGYWRLVFPTFDVDKQALPENAIPCTGRNVFADPIFKGGEWVRRYPVAVEEGEILLGSGGDRLKVLWFRTHKFVDGTEAGPLVLVRPKEDSAEVYAIGVYRAQTVRPFFGLERMGPEVVVTVSDEGCTGNVKREHCVSNTSLFLPRRGELVALTTFASARREYVNAGEPGAYGRIEYRLSTSAKYMANGVEVFEEITAKDTAGRELRRAELDRKYLLNDLELVASEDSLWPRIYPFQEKGQGEGGHGGANGAPGSGTRTGAKGNGGAGSSSQTIPAPPGSLGLPGAATLPGAPTLPGGPSLPSPSVPTPSVPSPTLPSTPTPSVPSPTIPSPTIPTPTIH